jgi:hypothetical protein
MLTVSLSFSLHNVDEMTVNYKGEAFLFLMKTISDVSQ